MRNHMKEVEEMNKKKKLMSVSEARKNGQE